MHPFRPCGKWPMHGQQVCETHGGKAPDALKAGAVRWAAKMDMVRAEKAVKTFGLPLKVDPQQALLDEIYRTAGHVQWLSDMIGNMDEKEIVWNQTASEHQTGVGMLGDAVDMTSVTEQARPAVWMELYQKERAHLVHVCKVAIQCGIAERQVRLAEEQGNAIAGMLRQVFEAEELQLTAIQITAARSLASKLLRQMRMEQRPAFAVVKQLPASVDSGGGDSPESHVSTSVRDRAPAGADRSSGGDHPGGSRQDGRFT